MSSEEYNISIKTQIQPIQSINIKTTIAEGTVNEEIKQDVQELKTSVENLTVDMSQLKQSQISYRILEEEI